MRLDCVAPAESFKNARTKKSCSKAGQVRERAYPVAINSFGAARRTQDHIICSVGRPESQ